MEATTRQFLEAVLGPEDGSDRGFIEVRTIQSHEGIPKSFFYRNIDELLDNWDTITKLNKEEWREIYYGVCLRKDRKGDKKAIKQAGALWADIDCKAEAKEDALGRIKAFPLEPSIIVDSGHGLHLYWLLVTPVDPSPKVENIIKGLAKALEGDSAVKDVSRVMRLPGTQNVKYPSSPKPCTVLSFKSDLKYEFDDFVEYRQPTREERSEKEAFIYPLADAEKVIAGCTFIQHCRDSAVSLEEPLWYAMISNLSRCARGKELIHEFSRPYPQYTPQETESKIAHALSDTGPHTCQTVQELGFKGCPEGGCGVSAPVVLGSRGNDLKELVEKATRDNYEPLLEEIAAIKNEIERELLIQTLAGRLGLNIGPIRKEVKKLTNSGEATEDTENVLIVHPSYEVNEHLMSLGFKETAIVGNRAEDRNFYLVSADSGIRLNESPTIQIGPMRVFFDLRERVLLDAKDRWYKSSIKTFLENQAPPAGVYTGLKGDIRQYLELTDDAHYGLLASYIIATYFNRCFQAFPYMFFYGKKGSGKSRALDFMNRLVMNGIKVQAITPASLGDSLDALRGTILVDQAESLSDPRNQELVGILADGYTRGGGKRRVCHITNKSRGVLEFETYGPKVFASYKNIAPDLKDRCILITMLRAVKEYPYPEAHLAIWAELRDKLYRLAMTRWREVLEIYKTAGEGVAHRVRELWRPIETVLVLEGVSDDEKDAVKTSFLESMLETQTELSETEEEVFRALFKLLGTQEEAVIAVQEVVNEISGNSFSDKDGDRRLATIVGSILSQLRLRGREGPRKTVTSKWGTTKTACRAYCFNRKHIKDVYERYHQTSGLGGEVVESPYTKANVKTTSTLAGGEEKGSRSGEKVLTLPNHTPKKITAKPPEQK